MEITTRELDWTSEDQDIWRAFLGTQTGSRLIPKLVEVVPELLEGGPTNEILIRAGKLAGFQAAVKGLIVLASPTPTAPPAPQDNYPDPTDDRHWNDGQKIG